MPKIILTAELVDRYRAWLLAAEKSTATAEKYVREVSAFAEYLRGGALIRERALEYKNKRISDGCAPTSVNSTVAALNSLFDFLKTPDCRLKSLRVQRRAFCSEQRELSREEYIRLVKTAERNGNDRLSLMLRTICGTGVRVGELRFITVEAARSGEAEVTNKGKTRTVFLVRDLCKKLLAYAKSRGIVSGAVFVTRSGKPVNRVNVWREMKALCAQARVSPEKVFPHNLRHLFARTFYGLEKDIAKLADILGHSSVDTTRIYIISTGEEHRRQMERMRLVC